VKASDRVDGPSIKCTRILCGVLLLIAFIFSAFVTGARALDKPRRVLILSAYNYTFPAATQVIDGVQTRLRERAPTQIAIDAEFLDLVRVADPAHELNTATFLQEKYARTPPDVVIVVGTAALQFIMKYRDAVAQQIPIVFAGVSWASYASVRPPPDVTGTIVELNLEKTLDLAEQLQPAARRLFVIAGNSPVEDRRWQEIARRTVENHARKFETTYLFGLSFDTLMTEVSRTPRDAIVIALTFFVDGAGNTFVSRDVAKEIARVSPAPVYGPYDTYIGNGVVGGFVETFVSLGATTADLVLEIVGGKDPATLPPRVNPQTYRVDARAMERWGLNQRDLPPGTTVLFKEPGLWDEHRNFVLGTIFIIVVQTAIVGALLFQRRRRRQAETSLKASEERMTFTAASANVGLWQFDRTTNELWTTDHCRAMFGLPGDVPLTRKTFHTAIHPDDRDIALATLRQTAITRQPTVTHVRVALPDNQMRWISIRARSRLDDQGTPNQLSGIFVDITDQKTAAAEAELHRQEVTHLTRISVLGQLSGAITHEVNQPLTAILSNAEAALHLLEQDAPDLVEIRDVLKDIVQEDNRAVEVVHRLHNLLKKGEAKAEPVDINELVNQTIALLRSELVGRCIMVKTDLAEDLPALSGDSVQLQQVLLNLFMNAMDAMASTPVALRLVMISTRATQSDTVKVVVKDRGPGIKPSQGGRLFEPFFTTKDHGLGLGLTICSTIVQAHGGKITLSNDDTDGGAIAGFSLPALEMTAATQ
jgi:signal transduction histidine kinase